MWSADRKRDDLHALHVKTKCKENMIARAAIVVKEMELKLRAVRVWGMLANERECSFVRV